GGPRRPAIDTSVIAGLDPTIHGAASRWMAGSSPAMTVGETRIGLGPPAVIFRQLVDPVARSNYA
ncbi:MAG: hypothetical protein MI785_04060, partial [Kiloniellales bacterium]|nr:hypothetical protein [Kiloniellales bacterium]